MDVKNDGKKRGASGASDASNKNRVRLQDILLLVVVLGMVLAISKVLFSPNTVITPAINRRPLVYYELKSRLPALPISDHYRPGFLFRGTEFRGGCTLVKTAYGWRVITAYHLLRSDVARQDTYTYELAYDDHLVEYPISKFTYPGTTEVGPIDFAIGFPGQAALIASISTEKEGADIGDLALLKEAWAVCLTSGTRHRIVAKHTNKPNCFIDYQPLAGESGTGFLVDGDPGTLLVLIRETWFSAAVVEKIHQAGLSSATTFTQAVMTRSPPLSKQ